MAKSPIPRVPSLADLKVVRNAVIEAGDMFRRAKDNLNAARERARVEAERSADELARYASSFDRREMVKAHVAKATKAFQDERAEKFGFAQKEIAQARTIVEHGRSLYTSKRSLLDMLTLGDASRATYTQNLAGAGPMALTQAASFALANKNAALAAAVAATVDRMPAAGRPIAVAELVRDLEHPEIDSTMALFAELDTLIVGGEVAAAAILDPDASSADRIRLGLEQRRVGLVKDGEDAAPTHPDASVSKIGRGLAARRAAAQPASSANQEGRDDGTAA